MSHDTPTDSETSITSDSNFEAPSYVVWSHIEREINLANNVVVLQHVRYFWSDWPGTLLAIAIGLELIMMIVGNYGMDAAT